MRLWHQHLIHYLDNKRLLGQHCECYALRGKGWGRKHATVDYVFKYDLAHLYAYHCIVMHEFSYRFKDFKIDGNWYGRTYRGKTLQLASLTEVGTYLGHADELIYDEYDDRYLKECLLNLKSKGAELVNDKTIEQLLIKCDLNN